MTNLKNLTRVEGPNLALRLIETDDAEYVHGLRINPAYNQHLSEVQGTAADQRAWIERYKSREATMEELYYIIERNDGIRCGTVRLYEIKDDRFTWGSWILDENKPNKGALESAVLIYRIGFDLIGKDRAVFDVRNDNSHTLDFHLRFGATETGKFEADTHFSYERENFTQMYPRFLDILKTGEKA